MLPAGPRPASGDCSSRIRLGVGHRAAGHGKNGAMGAAVVPLWVVPAEARVRAARRWAAARLDSSGGEVRYNGIVAALDWIAGVTSGSPVTEIDVEPAPGQALVELLAAEHALDREPRTRRDGALSATEQERQMERLGRGIHVAAVLTRDGTGRLRDEDIRYLDGVSDTLRWLLGEVDRPPVALPIE